MSDTAEKKESVVAAVVEEVRAPQAADLEASGPEKKTREQMNLENLKSVGALHGAAVIAALTLFGAAHTWAAVSGWMLAAATAAAAAVLAGVVISSIAHEWGHFSGTVLSGSRYKVARKPVNYFFMFSFDMAANSSRQAIWMSWGGLAGSWFVPAAVISLVPMDSWASAALAATVLGQAVNASVFEVPIILRTRASGEFEKELEGRLESPGVVRMPGLIVGLLAFALLT
jgi:hypothetical protein